MTQSWIDVSVPLHNGMPHWPGDKPFQIERQNDLEKGDSDNLSSLSTSAHVGTHMDAPLHFIRGARSIDEMPLEVTMGPARVVAVSSQHQISAADLEPHNLREGERVLFRTRNSDQDWSTAPFKEQFVSIGQDAARFIADRKLTLVGVDYLSVGAYGGDAGGVVHRALLGAGVWIIEGLDLRHIEPGDYELICLPLKLKGAEGAPARALLRRA
jgi:arylformamidase